MLWVEGREPSLVCLQTNISWGHGMLLQGKVMIDQEMDSPGFIYPLLIWDHREMFFNARKMYWKCELDSFCYKRVDRVVVLPLCVCGGNAVLVGVVQRLIASCRGEQYEQSSACLPTLVPMWLQNGAGHMVWAVLGRGGGARGSNLHTWPHLGQGQPWEKHVKRSSLLWEKQQGCKVATASAPCCRENPKLTSQCHKTLGYLCLQCQVRALHLCYSGITLASSH